MKTLVLCVDRDNDIGEKAHLTGPIIGIEENLNAARELGLADPEDTDVNAIFQAAKTAKELKCEVATLTGDWDVGIVSDEKISKQLDYVMEKFKPESVILITDGAEDEQLIPIIQSRVKINAVKTVIVRQSKELEKAYFTITNFLREVEKDAGLAHLIFVIPGLVLLLIAIGGALNILMQTMLLLLAIVGLYLIMKGLGFEEEFFSRTTEFFKSLSIERISVMAYVLAIFTLLIGISLNYEDYVKKQLAPDDYLGIIKTALTLNYADVVLLAFVIAIVGRIIDEYSMEKFLSIRRYIIFLALLVLATLTAQTGAYYFMGQTKFMDFSIAVMLSIVFFVVIVQSTELIFIEEINAKKRVIKEYAGRKVVNKEGAEIGKVTKVLLDDSKFVGIKVGRRKIEKDNISQNGEVIVAKT